jgi:hypothetical protein
VFIINPENPDEDMIEFFNRVHTVVIAIYPSCDRAGRELHTFIERHVKNHQLSFDEQDSMNGSAKIVFGKKYTNASRFIISDIFEEPVYNWESGEKFRLGELE